MFDGHWRSAIDRGVKPIGAGLTRLGVTPDSLTALGLVMSAATAVTIGAGHLRWGFVCLLFSALPDLLDGAVAKVSGWASRRGAFFDSVADRVTDAFVLGGIGWYLQAEHGGQYAMLAFAVLACSQVISYERAKAEIFSLQAKGGLMERAERIVAICVGLVFPVLLIPVLWVMLVLTALTVVQRFVKVWKQFERPAVPSFEARRAARVAARQVRRTQRKRLTERMAVNRVDRASWRQRMAARPDRVRPLGGRPLSETLSSTAQRWKERVESAGGAMTSARTDAVTSARTDATTDATTDAQSSTSAAAARSSSGTDSNQP